MTSESPICRLARARLCLSKLRLERIRPDVGQHLAYLHEIRIENL
jgi:hypothetical protein